METQGVMIMESKLLSLLGFLLLTAGVVSPSSPTPLGPCAATLLPREGGGYQILCTGGCDDLSVECSPRLVSESPIGPYEYCPVCTGNDPRGEPNCCHPVVQTNPPYGKYALGVCYGETGGSGCVMLGPCNFQSPGSLVAKCQGGLPPTPK